MAKIKEIYNESQKNKVKGKPTYSMPLDEFIEEHEDLIEIMRNGSKEELSAEADRQERELKKCLKEHGIEDNMEDEYEDDDEEDDD